MKQVFQIFIIIISKAIINSMILQRMSNIFNSLEDKYIENVKKNYQLYEEINKQAPINYLTAIIYKKNQLSAIVEQCQLAGCVINDRVNLQLLKSVAGINSFIILYNNEEYNETQMDLQTPTFSKNKRKLSKFASSFRQTMLNKVVGFSDHIVVYNFDNQTENHIQKQFLALLDQSYKFKKNKPFKLTFIKSDHKNQLRNREGIKYLQSLSSLKINKNYPLYQQTNLTKSHLVELMKVDVDTDKNINFAKLKFSFEKYNKLQDKRKKYHEANEHLFTMKTTKLEFERYVSKLNLGPKQTEHLLWKANRIEAYKNLLEQIQPQNLPKFDKFTISDLTPQAMNSGILNYNEVWLRNSLFTMKQIFNRIANRNDLKTIKQFRTTFRNYDLKLEELIENVYEKNIEKIDTIKEMQEQLKWFYQYHENVINGGLIASLSYFKNEAKYLWRNNKKIYQKLLIVFLLLLLAYFQSNLLSSITVLSLGLVFLAIKI